MAQSRRVAFMMVGAVVGLVAVVGTGVLLAGDPGVFGCSLLSEFGWVTPVVTGAVLGGATIALLVQRRSAGRDASPGDVLACPSCERDILGQWRMCPYCGQMLQARRSATTESRESSNQA
jgi:hypothetical protein